MATEQLIIQVSLTGARTVVRNLNRIGRVAATSGRALGEMDQSLVSIGRRRIPRATEDGVEGVGRAARQSQVSISALTTAIGLFASVQAARGLISYVNTFDNLQNRIRTVTNSTQELNFVTNELFEIAGRTRAPIDETARLYSRLTAAGSDLIATQQDIFNFTELAGLALATQGSTAQESQGALLQLSQAIGGTVIQAQEFNSLIDGARPLLEAVAAGSDRFMGSVNALRAAVRTGTVTSQEFFDAALAGSQIIEDRFGRSVLTAQQSLVLFDNELTRTFGNLNTNIGGTTAFSEIIGVLGDNVNIATAAFSAFSVVLSVALATRALPAVTAGVIALTTALLANPFVALGTAIAATAVALGVYNLTQGDTVEETRLLNQQTTEFANSIDRLSGVQLELNISNAVTQIASLTDDINTLQARQQAQAGALPGERRRSRRSGDEARAAERINGLLAIRSVFERNLAIAQGVSSDRADAAERQSTASDMNLIRNADNLEASLRTRALLIGNNTELARVNARIEVGNLQGINNERATLLRGLAEELDVKRRVQRINDIITNTQRSSLSLELQLEGASRAAADARAGGATEDEVVQIGAVAEQNRLLQQRVSIREDLLSRQREQQGLDVRETELRTLGPEGAGGQDTFDIGISQIEVARLELERLGQINPFDRLGTDFQIAAEQINQGLGPVGESLDSVFGPNGSIVTGLSDAAAEVIIFGGNFREAVGQLAVQATEQLLAALIQQQIQTLINTQATTAGGLAAVAATTASSTASTAATAVAVTTQTAANTTIAASAAPAAALTTAASFGANIGPAIAGLVAILAIASAFKTGGAFGQGGQIFANGGAFTNTIVTQPTPFQFGGGFGVMGEAGPEAIMPLQRDRRGRLGVSVQGGGPNDAGRASPNREGSGNTNIAIMNVIDPNMFGDFLSTAAGRKVFVNEIRKNSTTINSALGR